MGSRKWWWCAALLPCVAIFSLERLVARAFDDQKVAPQEKNASGVSAEEKAVRDASARFAEAFNKADAEAIAAQFVDDARVVDEDGKSLDGKEAIRQRFAVAFSANPGLKVDFAIDNIRFLSPEVAVEEGHATPKSAENISTLSGMYTAIYVKKPDGWRLAFVRDHASADESLAPNARAHLEELAWMVGEWVDESDEAVVRTDCEWSPDGNFLVRKFTTDFPGSSKHPGNQRIGWDPQQQQIRSWVFDANGGFSEGFWTRSGENQWVIKVKGTTAEGQTATATNIITHDHPDTMRWQSVDRTLGDEALPDTEEITIARRPPGPAIKPAQAPKN
jgi:uncharacterized protein (TIGR02246 family)